MPSPERVAAITLPGDRRDDLVAESAEAIATWFAAVVIYEDEDRRGREPGEMRELIASVMRKSRPDIVIKHAEGAHDALRQALDLADAATTAALFIYEKLSGAMSALGGVGATPWPELDLAGEDIVCELAVNQDGLATMPIALPGSG